MEALGIKYSPGTYQELIKYHCNRRNLEHALLLVSQAGAANIALTVESYNAVILLATQLKQAKMAHDLANTVQTESIRKLSPEILTQVLEICATEQYVSILVKAIGCSN